MTVKEENKIIEEISKEIIKRKRLLYSYEIKEILNLFIEEEYQCSRCGVKNNWRYTYCPNCGIRWHFSDMSNEERKND